VLVGGGGGGGGRQKMLRFDIEIKTDNVREQVCQTTDIPLSQCKGTA